MSVDPVYPAHISGVPLHRSVAAWEKGGRHEVSAQSVVWIMALTPLQPVWKSSSRVWRYLTTSILPCTAACVSAVQCCGPIFWSMSTPASCRYWRERGG